MINHDYKVFYTFNGGNQSLFFPTITLAKAVCDTIANEIGYADVVDGNNLIYQCKVDKGNVSGH